ncbi:MAG TPA: hypothetical protein VF665_11535 [Longimicrobium sp.]|jgi:hypothetical protein|uniref:hypothetical protein n=1 Tax=Longimicrobium sp. TaxID=2029185 RepID=UPI002ED9C638
MNYGRDYGNRNFVERAANTVRGWFGGEHEHYDREFRGGMYGGDRQRGGWSGGEGYREMGGMAGGYPRGGRSDFDSYRAGGYRPNHGSWDVEWDRSEPRGGGYGAQRGGAMYGGGMNRGMGGAPRGGYTDHDNYASRDFLTNQGYYDAHGGYRGEMEEPGMRGGRGYGGGYTGAFAGPDRGETYRGRVQRADYGREYRGGAQQQPGYGLNQGGAGDAGGGLMGNYGPYSSYGIERFRSNNSGGVQPGQYYTGYGVGTGYR